MKRVRFNGFTKETNKNFQLDAGAFFKNFIVGTDTYKTAKQAGKLLCATNGGGEASFKPSHSKIVIDGVPERTKGLDMIDDWEAYIKTTAVDITTDVLLKALGAAVIESEDAPDEYDLIKGKFDVDDSDYIENITWVGCISGSNEPIIIQLFNALDEDGLSFKVADKDHGKIDLTFYGYCDPDEVADGEELHPPFAIYRPKNSAPAAVAALNED